MKIPSRLALVLGAATAMVAVSAVPAQAAAHRTFWVHPGTGTISAAVARAHAGDTIRLVRGTYYDSVFIPIRLTITGAGWANTVIKPPATSSSPCNMGSMEGLCAAGAFDSHGNPDVSKPVVGVNISDLRVTGFSDSGVLGFNTRGLRVEEVRADHNGGYGIARFVSTRSVFEENWTSYNREAGLYMGDSPHADSVLRANWADHNGFGLFLRDSTDITAVGNLAWDNCIGIFALNTGGHGAPGDLPAGDYRIANNKVWDNDKECPANGEQPVPLSGIGIGLFGVHDTWVAGNEVRVNHPGGPSAVAGGVVMVSFAGVHPMDNTIHGNEVEHNRPADIVWDRTGSGNRVTGNECNLAIPGNRGWCTDID